MHKGVFGLTAGKPAKQNKKKTSTVIKRRLIVNRLYIYDKMPLIMTQATAS